MIQQYALLDPSLTTVLQAPVTIESTVYAAWVSSGNPKGTQYRIINMIAQPTFDPTTQQVVQNGWTITAIDVQPVWVVATLPAAAQQAIAATNIWNQTLTLNIVTAATNAINNWGNLTAAQKDTVLLAVVKVIRALLMHQYGDTN
jgi:hypothetical protein